MNNQVKCICPACKGTGRIKVDKLSVAGKRDVKKQVIMNLLKDGYSIRDVMRRLGYKSPSTIVHYLNT